MNEGYGSNTAACDSRYEAKMAAAGNIRKASACDDAYAQLAAAQATEESAIDSLFNRLGVVMRDPVPEAPSPVAEIPPPPQSELHGRLLAATQRARKNAELIGRVLDRLTV